MGSSAETHRSMVLTTLLWAAASAATVGTAYMYVGVRLAQRDVESPLNRRALLAFAVWWTTMAINILSGVVVYLLAALGTTSLPAQVALAISQRVLLAISLVGLMYYLTYVLTGRGLLVVWAVYGAALATSLLVTLYINTPVGVQVSGWRTDVETLTTAPTWLLLAHFVAITLPPLVGAIAYFMLYFKLPDWAPRMRRLRILVVSWGLILWWAVAVLAGQNATYDSAVVQITNRVVGVVVALAVLLVYHTPRRLQAWVDGPVVARTEAA